MSNNHCPDIFIASIGGYMGKSYVVEWQDGQLGYKVFRGSRKPKPTRKHKPSDEGWQEFWAGLDRIGVWDWEPNYTEPGTVDGTQWSLEIDYNDRKLKTGGSNAYPGKSDIGRYSPEFEAFLKAVQALGGGWEFE